MFRFWGWHHPTKHEDFQRRYGLAWLVSISSEIMASCVCPKSNRNENMQSIIFLLFYMGRKLISYPTERHRLKEFENRVLRSLHYLDQWEKTIHKRSFITFIFLQILPGWRNWRWWDLWGMQHRQERCIIHTDFWSKYLQRRNHSEDIGVGMTVILRWIFRQWYIQDVDWDHLA